MGKERLRIVSFKLEVNKKKKKGKNANRNKSQAPLKHHSKSAPFEEEDIEDSLVEDRDENYDQFRNPNGLHEYKERYEYIFIGFLNESIDMMILTTMKIYKMTQR